MCDKDALCELDIATKDTIRTEALGSKLLLCDLLLLHNNQHFPKGSRIRFTFGGLTSRVLSAFVIDTAPFHIILLHWDSTDYYGIMARTHWNFNFSMSYETKFKAAIRGRHVYNATWSPVMNGVLICNKDNREEAQEYDLNAVGVYKDIAEREGFELEGHDLVEPSRLLAGFLASDESNSLTLQVCGKRKREVGLVIPRCYNARTSKVKIADILSTEMKNI